MSQQIECSIVTPANYEEAMTSEQKDKWREAQNEEISSLEENKTWSYERLPPGKHAIDCMWIYTLKLDEFGNIARYKARLVAKGYLQKAGIDYHETFAPVMKYKSLVSRGNILRKERVGCQRHPHAQLLAIPQ